MAKMIISKQIRRLLKPTEMSPGDMYLVVLMMLVEARKSRRICGSSISSYWDLPYFYNGG